jgi:alpha-L-arabinofuranosidase
MAAYFSNPAADSPGFYAFKMFTNFDSKGSSFGDQAISTVSYDYQNVQAFAALDSKSNRMRLMLINNQPDKSRDLQIEFAKNIETQSAKVFELSAQTNNKISAKADLQVAGNTISYNLPAYSIVLLDIQL